MCEKYNGTLMAAGAELYVFSHIAECRGDRPYEVEKISDHFCCDKDQEHVTCPLPEKLE